MPVFNYTSSGGASQITRTIHAGNSNIGFVDGNIRITNEGTDFYAAIEQSKTFYNGELLVRFRYSGNDGLIGVVGFRFSGKTRAEADGYSVSLFKNGNAPGFVLYNNRVGTVRGTEYMFVHSPNEWYYVRANWDLDRIRYKVWRDTEREPSIWSVDIRDSSIPGKQGQTAGLYTYTSGTVEYSLVSYSPFAETLPTPAPRYPKQTEARIYSSNPYGAYYNAGYIWPTNSVQLKGNRAFEHLTISKPKLTHTPPRYTLAPNRVTGRLMITPPSLLGNGPKYNFRGNRGWVHLITKTRPTLTYTPPVPGELHPNRLTTRLIVPQPTLATRGPVYTLNGDKTTTRVSISSPALTALAAALIQPERVNLRIGISSPNVIFIPKPEVLELKPAPLTLRLTITRTNDLLDPSVYNIEYKQYKPDYVDTSIYTGETLNIDRYRPDTIETGKIDSIELETNRYKQTVIK